MRETIIGSLCKVEGQNYLGIYLSKDAATVVCLNSQGREHNILGCFSVSAEQAEEPYWQVLANLITQNCAERGWGLSEAAVALDCAMFMQHNIHSEFDDTKQIAATIRFDTEEVLAADISDIAIAFKVISSDQAGSQLAVFTAKRKLLSDILFSLQSGNIDPVTMEPDVNCLSRFVLQDAFLSEGQHPFFGILSGRSGYFITLPESQNVPAMRTFLVGPAQDRNTLLAREIPVTVALVDTGRSINNIGIFDSTGSVNCQQLGGRLGMETNGMDLVGPVSAEPVDMSGCAGAVDFAIAYGAALAHLEKTHSVNFRNDFSPFQGKKLRLQRSLRFLSISITVLILSVGLYLQLQLLQKNRPARQLRGKFAKQYSAVMLGKRPPAPTKAAVKKLSGELRRIENVKKGLLSGTGEESVSAKLTLVLEAFNACAARTDLSINSISITDKTIIIAGETSSRRNTLKLFEAVKRKLEILQQRLDSKGGRDSFRITVVPKK